MRETDGERKRWVHVKPQVCHHHLSHPWLAKEVIHHDCQRQGYNWLALFVAVTVCVCAHGCVCVCYCWCLEAIMSVGESSPAVSCQQGGQNKLGQNLLCSRPVRKTLLLSLWEKKKKNLHLPDYWHACLWGWTPHLTHNYKSVCWLASNFIQWEFRQFKYHKWF